MGSFQAVFYRDSTGAEPVREFLDGLGVEAQVAVSNQIDRLNLLDDEMPHLPFPHSSQVDGELRELPTMGGICIGFCIGARIA